MGLLAPVVAAEPSGQIVRFDGGVVEGGRAREVTNAVPERARCDFGFARRRQVFGERLAYELGARDSARPGRLGEGVSKVTGYSKGQLVVHCPAAERVLQCIVVHCNVWVKEAALHADSDILRVLDLGRRSVRVLDPACPLLAEPLAWSPDGRWLAVGCRSDGGVTLSVLRADGSGGPSWSLRRERRCDGAERQRATSPG